MRRPVSKSLHLTILGHLSSATCHPPGVAGEVAGQIIQHPVCLPSALGEIRCETSPA